MTAKDIDLQLRRYYKTAGYHYHLSNKYLFAAGKKPWESDFLVMNRKSHQFYEVEVKVSKSDYQNDLLKGKHPLLEAVQQKNSRYVVRFPYPNWEKHIRYNKKKSSEGVDGFLSRVKPFSTYRYEPVPRELFIPNRFFFCFPEGLIDVESVPKYAGVLHAYPGRRNVQKVREAPILHKRDMLSELKDVLLEKFFYESYNHYLQEKRA